MIAVELETSVHDHRVDVRSDLLPATGKVRIIVMYEQPQDEGQAIDVLARARAAQASFPKRPTGQLMDDMAALRGEWDRAL